MPQHDRYDHAREAIPSLAFTSLRHAIAVVRNTGPAAMSVTVLYRDGTAVRIAVEPGAANLSGQLTEAQP